MSRSPIYMLGDDELKYDIIDLYNLFAATCCQLDQSLPLLYHSSDGKVGYPTPSDDLVTLMHELAFDHMSTYRKLTKATAFQEQQELRLEIVDMLWRDCAKYMQ